MRTVNRYGDVVATEVKDLVGAVVVNNCAVIRLADGTECVFQGFINPEDGDTREFIDSEGGCIELPIRYEVNK